MEDKQIYSTGRSEEIKRQIVKWKKQFSRWLEKRREKSKKEKEKEEKVIVETPPPPVIGTIKEEVKASDYDSLYEDNAEYKPELVIKSPPPKDNLAEQHLKTIVSYTLFGLIVLIILIGIYLSYGNK